MPQSHWEEQRSETCSTALCNEYVILLFFWNGYSEDGDQVCDHSQSGAILKARWFKMVIKYQEDGAALLSVCDRMGSRWKLHVIILI